MRSQINCRKEVSDLPKLILPFIHLRDRAMLIATRSRAIHDGLRIALRHISTSESAHCNYPGHVPLTAVQNAVLALGSGVVGVLDTNRAGE